MSNRKKQNKITRENVALNVGVGGTGSHNVVFAARAVHIYGNPLQIVGMFGVIAVLIVFGILMLSSISAKDAAQPMQTQSTPATFAHGKPFVLDVAIVPFRLGTFTDDACASLARTLPDRVADEATAIFQKSSSQAQDVAIWRPNQLDANVLAMTGTSVNDVTSQAQLLASKQQIDVVLTGDVSCDSNRTLLTLSTFVSPNAYHDYPELSAVVNAPIVAANVIQIANSQPQSDLVRRAAERFDFSMQFGRILESYQRGTQDSFLNSAKLAEELLNSVPGSSSTQATLHYVVGNAYIRASRDDCDVFHPEFLTMAEQHLNKAIALEPQMAMAYAALGDLLGYRADVLSPEDEDERASLLQDAGSYYEKALAAKVAPNRTLLEAAVMLGRGRNKILEHDAVNRERILDGADALLQRVTAISVDADTAPLAARALALRGSIQLVRRNSSDALALFQQALTLTSERKLRSALAQNIAQIQTTQGDVCGAATHYRLAADTLCLADQTDQMAQAQDLQLACKLQNDSLQAP